MEKIKVLIIESVKKTLEPTEGILMQRDELSVSCGIWINNQIEYKFKGKTIP